MSHLAWNKTRERVGAQFAQRVSNKPPPLAGATTHAGKGKIQKYHLAPPTPPHHKHATGGRMHSSTLLFCPLFEKRVNRQSSRSGWTSGSRVCNFVLQAVCFLLPCDHKTRRCVPQLSKFGTVLETPQSCKCSGLTPEIFRSCKARWQRP